MISFYIFWVLYMDVQQKIQDLENSVGYLLSEIQGERLQEIEHQINFLLTEIQGRPKLIKLIDGLQKDNERLSSQANKLIRENVSLKESLSHQQALVKQLRLVLDVEKIHFY